MNIMIDEGTMTTRLEKIRNFLADPSFLGVGVAVAVVGVMVAIVLLIETVGRPRGLPTNEPEAKSTTNQTGVSATEEALRLAQTAIPTFTPTPTPTFTPTPTPTFSPICTAEYILKDWTLCEVTTEGFAIALPPGWQQLDLSPDGLEAMLSALEEQNPIFGEFITSEYMRRQVANGVKFFALDSNPASLIFDVLASASIVKIDLGLAIPIDVLVSNSLEELESIADPEIPITHRRVTLSNMEAEEFKYGSEVTVSAGESISVSATQYMGVDETIVYTITLISPPELSDTYASAFEEIGRSFRLLR